MRGRWRLPLCVAIVLLAHAGLMAAWLRAPPSGVRHPAPHQTAAVRMIVLGAVAEPSVASPEPRQSARDDARPATPVPPPAQPAPAAEPVASPAPAPADARSRLPGVFDELLREGGDGLFDAVERALVHAAFEHAHRNQVRSAKALGVTRNMVRTLLKRHGLLAAGAAEFDADLDAGEPGGADPRAGGRFSLSAV